MTKEVPESLDEAARNFRRTHRSKTLGTVTGCLTLAVPLVVLILALVVAI